jgi:hypothetical protein
MKTRGVALFITAVVLVLTGGELSAREVPPHTIEVWGGGAVWEKSTEDGAGGPATGATALFHVGLPVQLGFDLAFARYDPGSADIEEFTASIAVRYRFPFLHSFRPFVGTRTGYTRLSAELLGLRLEQNGALIGGSAGFEIPMGSRVMLTATGEAMYQGYKDAELFLGDYTFESSAGNAWRYWARLGLTFRWRR